MGKNRACLVVLAGLVLGAAPVLSQAGLVDYPTVDRVLYVNRCVREHPGPVFEMVNKCACVFDRVATQVSYDDFLTMSTASDANRIGGERGSYIREAPTLQQQIRRWNTLQSDAQRQCQVDKAPS